ncbi:MAG: AAA family ATPase [Bacteroidaceae bacterium]|nr:AAA family ATPase [Bacteroidaceae bacterium]
MIQSLHCVGCGPKRKYPVGIQSFESIRKDGYLYIDKTPLIYKMISEGKPYFLSRPRRFGKSLLISTLQAVFEGRRELFEAFTTEDGIEQPQLYIAQTDWRWEKHPVIRFDLSETNMQYFVTFEEYVKSTLLRYERELGLAEVLKDSNHSLADLVRAAHEQTGKRVVVLVDEYDTLMLHSLGDQERVREVREMFTALFGPLKALDDHLQFVFITGISKFSQMGIFSKLNNLQNISMVPAFDALCGISEEELTTLLRPDIELLGEANGLSYDEQLAELKYMYDGYHFSEKQTDMYNPFSLVNAFKAQKVGNYWFDRGTSGALINLLAQMPPVDIAEIEHNVYPSTMFDLPFESFDDPLPILYQSGYLTIKSGERDEGEYFYTLGIPNQEVRRGFAECLYKHVAGKGSEVSRGVFFQAYVKFRRTGDLPPFIEAIKVFFAGLPYQWEKDNRNEHYYHALLYPCSRPSVPMSWPRNRRPRAVLTSPCVCPRASMSSS